MRVRLPRTHCLYLIHCMNTCLLPVFLISQTHPYRLNQQLFLVVAVVLLLSELKAENN